MNIKLIPCKDLNFNKMNTKIAYDITVEDYETFTTDKGLVVYDTVAIFAPQTEEAQQQVKERMISAVSPEGVNTPNFSISKEMLIGLFTMTYLERPGEYKQVDISKIEDLHVGQKVVVNIKGEKIKSTAGRVLFNTLLPPYVPFINRPMDSKLINQLLSQILNKNHSDYAKTVNNFSRYGFKYATLYPQTIALDMMKLPPNLIKLKEELKKEKDTTKQMEIVAKMDSELLTYLEKNEPGLYIQVKSGSIKSMGSLRAIMVAKGVAFDPNGKMLPPISESHLDGLPPETYYAASAASRKATIDRALNTANGGYAYRKMVYNLGNVLADPKLADCGTKKYFSIKLTPDLFKRMKGRYVADPDTHKVTPITEKMVGKLIYLRSPIFCKSKGICRICYGDLIKQLKTTNVGIVSAMMVFSLSEKIMKCSQGMLETNNQMIPFDELWKKTK